VKYTPIRLALLVVLILVPCAAQAGKIVFSVSPGQAVESAQLGLSTGTIMPYFGFDLLGVAAKAKTRSTNSYVVGTDVVLIDQTEDLKGSAMLFIPHFGARLYFGKNDVRPYVFGDVLKSIASVNVEGVQEARAYLNGVLVDTARESIALGDEAEEQIKKVLGFWGVSTGFGGEYAFSEHFNLGGEYALRWFHTSTKSGSSGGSPVDNYASLYDYEVSGSLKMSTGRIWLNYRF
jgi:hypothetical protein